jgi:serine/threonine protein kinase
LLLDRISVGGMAEVFKAKSYGVEGFEKIIAIKRILPTMGEDRDFIKMFIDEAKIAGQLAHANICQIFELGRIDGSHFIAMEYIWGKDLLQIQNRLRKTKQAMPINMACFVIAKVLEGLDYAHRKRDPLGRPLEIVHRDCSPQNVLVSYEGEVKVIDFGIAKATSRNSRTMAGVLKGKFGYMSPEQVRGLPLDRRSDIFAIGTMLYECLTGERLFQGETDFSTLEKVRNVDIAAPRQVNPAIPEPVEKIILKALSKDVEDRYQWCSEMLADLQAYLMSQDVVFTAKSLATWLKDVFVQEIDRERQLLEQYKRVGRDGLIAGVPSAQAKLDVDEHLGEAGQPEGDATMLGGPNFDDVEKDTGAAPDVHQMPAAGGPRGAVQRKGSSKPTPVSYREDEEGEGDFGEEAPTEIFGETESPPPVVSRTPSRDLPSPRAQTHPPRPPPRPSSQQPLAARAPSSGGMQDGLAAAQAQAYNPNAYGQPMGTPPGQHAMHGPPSGPIGTPGGMPPAQNPHASQSQPQRTVLGVQAPVGLGNYGGGYRPTGPMQPELSQHPQHTSGAHAMPQHQSGSHAMPQHQSGQHAMPMQQPHGYPQGFQHPHGSYPGYPQPGYPQQQYGYPSGQMPAMPMGAVEHAPMAEGKRSTLVRDIGIGVGIAALVLVGFLVVKMFVLDKDKAAGTTTSASTFATVKLAMPTGIAAEMFVDGERVATVTSDSPEIPVRAGIKHIKLVGTNGLSCDDPKVNLEAGKKTTLECNFGMTGSAAPSGSATEPQGSGAQLAQGSAQQVAQGSAATDVGSAAAPAKPIDPAPVEKKPEPKTDVKVEAKVVDKPADKTVDKPADKPIDKKPVETKKVETPKVDTKPKPEKVTEPKPEKAVGGDPTKGYLQVFSKPTAKILVDGQDTNLKTPISGQTLGLTPGKHKITFVIGDDRFTYPVIIKAGVTETMSKDLE